MGEPNLPGFTGLRILENLEGEGAEYRGRTTVGKIAMIGGLPGGMKSGKASVGILVELEGSSQVIFAETSLSLFLSAADFLKVKHGDPRREQVGRAEFAGAPTVHHLQHGFSDCRMPGVPRDWPEGHLWSADWPDVTCETCLACRPSTTGGTR